MKRTPIAILLTLALCLSLALPALAAEAGEPNDTVEQATPLDTDTTLSADLTPHSLGDGDQDWYRLTLDEPGGLTLSLRYDKDLHFSAIFYRQGADGQLESLRTHFCPAAPADLHATWFPATFYLQPGTYYLKLSANGYTQGEYTLTTSFTALTEGVLENEPNEDSTAATVIDGDTTVSGSFYPRGGQDGDTDWYRFTTTNDNGLRLSFRLPSVVSFTAAVYAPDATGALNVVWSDSYSRPEAEDTATSTYTTQVLDLARGTYYLRLYANPGNEGNYTLQLLPVQGEQPSSWAREDVYAAIDQGLVPADLQKNYTGGIARQDMAAVVVCLLEQVSGQSIEDFLADQGLATDPNTCTDTRDPDVLAASALGILGGVGEGRFAPERILTRGQIGAILNRTAQALGVGTQGYSHHFTDTAGHWCDGELGWPYAKGIVDGVGGGRFNPDGPLTTEQAIVIAWRAWEVLS